MKIPMYLAAAALVLAAAARAETPETILIRKTLRDDLSGRRRGDAELALSAYHEEFFAFEAHGNADPRAWTVLHEDRGSLSRDLGASLIAYQFDLERTLPFIYVRGDQAMVTSVDSGRVIERRGGTVQQVRRRHFWTLRKIEQEWLVTGMVHDLGDSLLAVPAAGPPSEEIVAALRADAQAWNAGNRSRIVDFCAEHFFGYSAYGTVRPETWKIIFSGVEELEPWLESRLEHVSYQLDRRVVYAVVGPQRRLALAITDETLRATPRRGEVVHSLQRYVLYTLARRGSSWQVTNMCHDLGLARPGD